MSFLSAEIRSIRSSSLAHNAGWMLVGQGTNLFIQAGYFILLARLLGVKEYGIFVGALAFVSLATPYSGLGSGLVFVQHVSSNTENFAAYWGNVLLSTLSAGVLITALLDLIAPHLLNPDSASIVLILAFGECIGRQLVNCIGQVFQAFEQLRIMAGVALLSSSLRLLAVAVLALLLHRATARQWALTSLLVSLLAALAGSGIVMARYGRPRFRPRLLLERLGEGLNFSLAGSSQFAYNDIDKAMLSHYGMNVANGIYTVAYRIVDFATVPVTALDTAALPRYFQKSKEGAATVRILSFRLAWRAALVGALTAGCMFIAAPLIPHILGREFGESIVAFRWLCLIPAFRGLHQLTGSAITGLGFQRYRTVAQLGAAAFNFGLTLWLIPRYGWLGAAWASLATDGSLVVASCTILRSVQTKALEV
jgi:O-antigen/teichoic acid export membrane protein